MLHTMIQLSALSRITSYSISFQPATERSAKIWWIGESFKPRRVISYISSSLCAIPPPVPPNVYAGRMMIG